MDDVHVMVNEASNDREALFSCPAPGCGRRVVIGIAQPGFTVLDRGDFFALHVGTTGRLVPAVDVA